jgi:cyanophycin synthetase
LGAGYDWSDISVLTNIQPDHIGQDGIETLEDLLHIKSLVAERVREGGTLVLNGDDDQIKRLVELPRVRKLQKKLVYFSLDPDNPLLASQLAGNGTCYFRSDGWIVESVGSAERRLMRDSHIPATLNGTAWFQTANAMAAIAAARAFGLSVQDIVSSLRAFQSLCHNPGRANLYQLNGGYILVDYGHNPGSFEAVCRTASQWNDRRTTAVIAVPGDRSDRLIAQAACIAALGFDRLFIREDKDGRGREPGEIAQLLFRAVQESVPGRECTIVLDEAEALNRRSRR